MFIKDDLEEDLGRILDAKYEKADLPKIVSDYNHISTNQKQQLLRLLQKHETLFDGTLGTWKGSTYDIELKDNVKPYHARAYNMPKSIEKTMKLQVDRLCKIGVLKRVNRQNGQHPHLSYPRKTQLFDLSQTSKS